MLGFPDFPIGFGSASISGEGGGYGFGAIDEASALKLLESSFEQGIKLYDTAPIYGFGMAEKRLGKAFHNKREKVFIVSKGGVTWDSNKRVDKNNHPDVIQKMLEQSLTDLQSDYIDLYMIHWPDERHDIRPAMEVLTKAKANGKIRFIGLCNTNADDFKKASEICRIDALQDNWNLFSWNESYWRMGGFGKAGTIFRMGYGTFDKGILTGRVDENRKFDSHDARSWAPWWKAQDKAKKIKIVRSLKLILDDYGFSLPQFALWFALQWKDFLDASLIGVKDQQQLESLMTAYKVPISIGTIREIVSQLELEGYNPEDQY
jgi:myo-inositol catabolism protein IolS